MKLRNKKPFFDPERSREFDLYILERRLCRALKIEISNEIDSELLNALSLLAFRPIGVLQ